MAYYFFILGCVTFLADIILVWIGVTVPFLAWFLIGFASGLWIFEKTRQKDVDNKNED